MPLVGAAAAGAAVGVGHALETDHLAAVTTLVEGADDGSAAVAGASLGLGHTVPSVALAVACLALGIRVPAALTLLVE